MRSVAQFTKGVRWGAMAVMVIGIAACSDKDVEQPTTSDKDAEQPTTIDLPLVSETLCLAMQTPRGDSDAAKVTREKMLDLAAGAGVKWLRSDILWHQVEPEPGQFKFDGYERVVNAAASRGIELIGLLTYGNAWASSQSEDENNVPPDDPADFAAFASRVAQQFKGRIHRYEIWNEPNVWLRFWITPDGGAEPGRYGELLAHTASALRGIDTSLQVMFGGTLFHGAGVIMPGTLSFVEEAHLLNDDLAAGYDVMAWHPYMQYPPRNPPEFNESLETSLPEMWTQMKSLMDGLSASDKALTVTELGWPVAGPVTEDLQAAYLIRAHLLSLENGARSVCWYTLMDGEESSSSALAPEHAFGLVRIDGTLKPSYLALKLLGETLGDYRFHERLVTDSGVHALVFIHAESDKKMLAVWSESGSSTVTLPGVNESLQVGPMPTYHPVSP